MHLNLGEHRKYTASEYGGEIRVERSLRALK